MLKGSDILLHAPQMPSKMPGQFRNGRFRLSVEMPQQPIPLSGHHGRQTFPGFKRQNPLRLNMFTALSPDPGRPKCRQIVLEAAPDGHLDIVSHCQSPAPANRLHLNKCTEPGTGAGSRQSRISEIAPSS